MLEVAPFQGGAAFRIEAVLTERHPAYKEPNPGEVFTYQRCWLQVWGAESELSLSGALPAVDASGEIDWGHIETFEAADAGWWELQGDWGILRVREPSVAIEPDWT